MQPYRSLLRSRSQGSNETAEILATFERLLIDCLQHELPGRPCFAAGGCPVAYRSARAPSDRDSTRVPITRSSRSTECTHTLHRRFARRCTRPATSAHVHGPRPHTPGEMQMLADFQQQQSSPRKRVTSLTRSHRGVTHLDILRVYPVSISLLFVSFLWKVHGVGSVQLAAISVSSSPSRVALR